MCFWQREALLALLVKISRLQHTGEGKEGTGSSTDTCASDNLRLAFLLTLFGHFLEVKIKTFREGGNFWTRHLGLGWPFSSFHAASSGT